MRPLHIFVVHPSKVVTDYLPSGAGWIVYNYLKGLAERDHVIHVAAPRVEMRGPVPAGLHLHVMSQQGRLSYIYAVRRLFFQLSKLLRFDIAQQFTPVDTGLSFAVCGTGVPLVLGPYSGFWPPGTVGPVRQEGLLGRLKRCARDSLASLQQQQASALIITCPAAIERVASERARKSKLHIIGHGIDSQAYRARDQVPGKPSILFLALLEYRKGIFTLLDAFDRVALVIPECTLEIWGDGADAEAARRRALQSPFRERIAFRGAAPRDQVGEIMRSHSLYCMPSFGEPFGMTLLEAMASGVPVVTTDVGGPPHLIHPAGGRTVPVRNVEKLTAALLEVLSSSDLQQRMGAYNRQRVEAEFDWSRSLDRLERVYERVLSSPPMAPLRAPEL